MLEFLNRYFFLVTFGSLIAAGVGLPIPEELPVVYAGARVDTEVIQNQYGVWRWLILPTCILGVVISDGLLYGIGRRYGTKLLERRFFARMLPPDKRVQIEENFHKHGIKVLLFARMLPGIRSPIFIMAGVMKLPLRRFLIADGIYAIPGVSLLFFLAWYFQQQFVAMIEAFEDEVNAVRPIIILAALVILITYMIYRFWRKPVSTGEPDVPLVEKVTELTPVKQVTELIEGKHPTPGEEPPKPELG